MRHGSLLCAMHYFIKQALLSDWQCLKGICSQHATPKDAKDPFRGVQVGVMKTEGICLNKGKWRQDINPLPPTFTDLLLMFNWTNTRQRALLIFEEEKNCISLRVDLSLFYPCFVNLQNPSYNINNPSISITKAAATLHFSPGWAGNFGKMREGKKIQLFHGKQMYTTSPTAGPCPLWSTVPLKAHRKLSER